MCTIVATANPILVTFAEILQISHLTRWLWLVAMLQFPRRVQFGGYQNFSTQSCNSAATLHCNCSTAPIRARHPPWLPSLPRDQSLFWLSARICSQCLCFWLQSNCWSL